MQLNLFNDDSIIYNIVSEPKIVYETTIPYSERIHTQIILDAEKVFRKFWTDDIELNESIYALYANSSFHTLAIKKLNIGTSKQSMIDIQSLLRYAILFNAQNIIIAHNHPSGMLQASPADKLLTKNVMEACAFHDIHLIDHLILTKEYHLSFANEGLL